MESSSVLGGCKAVAAVLFIFGALLGAAVPFMLERCNLGKRISYLNAFAGGAFLALGILHIMPEAVKLLNEQEVHIQLNGRPFGVTYLLTFLGYLIILFCEGVLSGDSHQHLPGECEILSNEERKEGKGSCTTKSSQSDEHDVDGPLDALEAGGTLELATTSAVASRERPRQGSTGSDHRPIESGRKSFDSGAFFMMLALAIHGLFEGAIVGASSDVSMMWMMTAVVLGHKWAEAMLLMCQLLERNVSLPTTCLLLGAFTGSSPLGVLIGAILAAEGKLASGICNALGAGTVLYIASEISGSAFHGCRKGRFLQFLTYCSGSTLVLGLTLLDVAYGQ